jgi:ribosomal-protein-alanine N-acetyltransferase
MPLSCAKSSCTIDEPAETLRAGISMGTPDIQPIAAQGEAETCARMMCASEPWLTLGRTYEAALGTLTDHTKEVYRASRGEEILAFLILDLNGPLKGYIQTLCVAEKSRGQGIGSALLRFGEERIFCVSPNVFMCVSSFNVGAKSLYLRSGYSIVGELTDYIVAGHSEILLRKTRGPLKEFVQQGPPPAPIK